VIESLKKESALVGGLRFQNKIKQSSSNAPLVTIITATFNAASHLPRTIQSVRELTYKNIEWIVVDGGSTDQTVELIIKNEDVIDYWVSEPDEGIYDAWNKGVEKANGEWIAFLGAGDVYKPEAITNYVDAIQASVSKPNFASSRVQLVNDAGLVLREWGSCFDWTKFIKFMNIAHVGSLHHKELFEKY
jgi:glycosyltransferase involved in cell wall biosynthesis